ncbi:MAG: patatin-like phospholipase family protein [Actinomycetota bacterium]|nr:patatin-like phospholipase family protein [Actinomycetota bacterium]
MSKLANIGRRLRRRPANTVFVLSGGAVRGAAQVGMLRTLLRNGVVPDQVVGVSVGALNGLYLSADPTLAQIDNLEAGWLKLVERALIRGNVFRTMLSIVRGRPSFDNGERLREFIEEHVPVVTLEETAIPFYLGTTNASTGLVQWWRNGPAVDLLCASAAVPGMLPAVELADGHHHLDGGVVSNIPLRHALSLAPSRLVVLDVASRFLPPEKHTALSLMMVGFRAATAEVTHQEWADVPKGFDVLHIAVPGEDAGLDIDFEEIPQLIEKGEGAAEAALADYRS